MYHISKVYKIYLQLVDIMFWDYLAHEYEKARFLFWLIYGNFSDLRSRGGGGGGGGGGEKQKKL